MKSLDTNFCSVFGIRYPVVLAGMAGGPSTPELVATISRAGGLGTLGAAYMTPEKIREAIRSIRKLTDAPFAVNLFISQMQTSTVPIERNVQYTLNQMRDDLGLPQKYDTSITITDNFDQQFAVLIEEKVPVISTAFGILSNRYRDQAKAAGVKLIAMATTVEEAILAEKAGCDAVVAQGMEAGGHRGTFDVSDQSMGANVGLFSLLPQIVDHLHIPVLAAGGIMDGRGLVAALALGASGVQMGTKFLTTIESGAHPAYKQALIKAKTEDVVLTTVFSGRPARGIKNRFMEHWEKIGVQPMHFPIQNSLTRDIRDAASAENNTDYMSLWAGQGVGILTQEQYAEEVFLEIVGEANRLL
ncbi:NAD(P)H-dependent flavin oxidoreductase [Shimazuella kribbensis]|uniref:NAD(P)H-dependent flavin oxidoreductase n=1 Tax=Shimazuella kribbensis TaxID=139808 RepID=UPI0004136A0C|nr:nitronate monooxygenase family protein [Shimazuella kribbensis]